MEGSRPPGATVRPNVINNIFILSGTYELCHVTQCKKNNHKQHLNSFLIIFIYLNNDLDLTDEWELAKLDLNQN